MKPRTLVACSPRREFPPRRLPAILLGLPAVLLGGRACARLRCFHESPITSHSRGFGTQILITKTRLEIDAND